MRAQRVLKRVCVCRVQRKFPFCALSSDDKIKQRKEHYCQSLLKSLIRTPKSVILTQIWLCKCLFLTPRERLSSLYFALKFGPKRHKAFLHLLEKTSTTHKTRFLLSYYICFLLLRNTTRGRQTRKKKQTNESTFYTTRGAPSLR